jgi:hypothetical protein
MRKSKNHKARKWQNQPAYSRSQGAQIDNVRDHVTRFGLSNPNSKCIVVLDVSVIDSFMLHFGLSRTDAVSSILRHVSVESHKNKSTRGFKQLKIKNKPIVLWVVKQKTWKGDSHRLFITLKPTFIITSVEEIADKLAHQAIVDMLGD